MSAARVSSTNSFVIRDNDEISSCLLRLRITLKLGVSESEDEIIGGSAREVAAVLYICPCLWRLSQESPASVVNIDEFHVFKVVLRDLVRIILIALKDDRFLSAHSLADEVLERVALVEDPTSPSSLLLRLRNR